MVLHSKRCASLRRMVMVRANGGNKRIIGFCFVATDVVRYLEDSPWSAGMSSRTDFIELGPHCVYPWRLIHVNLVLSGDVIVTMYQSVSCWSLCFNTWGRRHWSFPRWSLSFNTWGGLWWRRHNPCYSRHRKSTVERNRIGNWFPHFGSFKSKPQLQWLLPKPFSASVKSTDTCCAERPTYIHAENIALVICLSVIKTIRIVGRSAKQMISMHWIEIGFRHTCLSTTVPTMAVLAHMVS